MRDDGFEFLSRVFGMQSTTWIIVAYLACMFLVGGFRSQNIGSPALFRLSFVLFALYIIIPALANGIVTLSMLDRPPGAGFGRRGPMSAVFVIQPLMQMLSQLLFGISVICGLASLRLGREYRDKWPIDRDADEDVDDRGE